MERILYAPVYPGKNFDVFYFQKTTFNFNRFKSILRKSHAFEVKCIFTENSAQTLVQPLNWPKEGFIFPENATTRCVEPNCFTKIVEYGPSKEQIKVRTVFL